MRKYSSLLFLGAFSLVSAHAVDSCLDLYVGAGGSLGLYDLDNTFETTDPTAMSTVIIPGRRVDGGLVPHLSDRKVKDSHKIKPDLSLVLGLGKHLQNNTYVGLEGGIDISKTTNIYTKAGLGYDYSDIAHFLILGSNSKIKLNSVSYNLGVVLGLYDNKNMFYIKPGMLFNSIFINDYVIKYSPMLNVINPDSVGYSKKQIAFALAFGIAHKLSNKLGLRLECEYVFPTKIKAVNDSYATSGAINTGTYQLESRVNRFKLRALLTCKLLNSWAKEDVCKVKTDTFDGLFIGAGIGINVLKSRAYRLAHNVGWLIAHPEIIGAKRVFDDQNVNRPFGTLLLGYGHSFYNNIYLGVDGLVDITKSRYKSITSRGIEIINDGHDSDGGYVKYGGVSAEIGPRFGYLLNNSSSLVYVRPALMFNKVDLWNDSRRTCTGPEKRLGGHQPSPLAFALAIGVEKALKKNFTIRVELERVFKRCCDVDSTKVHGNRDTGWRTRGNVHRYNARVVLSYKLK